MNNTFKLAWHGPPIAISNTISLKDTNTLKDTLGNRLVRDMYGCAVQLYFAAMTILQVMTKNVIQSWKITWLEHRRKKQALSLDQKALDPCKFTWHEEVYYVFFDITSNGNLTIIIFLEHCWMKVKIQILWVGDAISTFQVDGIECFTIMRRKLQGGDVDNSTQLGVKYCPVPWADFGRVDESHWCGQFSAEHYSVCEI